MISVHQLHTLISYGPEQLSELMRRAGLGEIEFASAEFLGITNGWQFCYKVTPRNEEQRGTGRGKVFLTYDHATGRTLVEY